MSQFTLRHIAPISLAKVLGVIYTAMGLLFGAFISLATLGAGASRANPAFPFPTWLLGMGTVIALPILYGIVGFIGGLVGGMLYNFVAGIVGGVVIEVDHNTNLV